MGLELGDRNNKWEQRNAPLDWYEVREISAKKELASIWIGIYSTSVDLE
jgi:hypothetical protein